MSDDLARAQEELAEQTRWGESRETKALRLIVLLLQGKSRGPYMRVVAGHPTWRPQDGEPCIDRLDARLYVGFDGQWYSTQLTPLNE